MRDKQRQAYQEAMRMNNNQPLEPETLSKFGIDGFEPTPDEINDMMEQLKDQQQQLQNTGG